MLRHFIFRISLACLPATSGCAVSGIPADILARIIRARSGVSITLAQNKYSFEEKAKEEFATNSRASE
jgi:hypothetical protein